MKVTLTGRTDVQDYFSLSGIRETSRLSHHPFIVFLESGDELSVEVIDNPRKLLGLPDSTKVMAQWEGNYRSDFFQFTVGDLKDFIDKNPKKDYHVI